MNSVDLYAIPFWAFVCVSVLVMVPLTRAPARKWAFASINAAFLVLHVQPGYQRALLGIFVGVVLAWLVINVAALPSRTGSLAVWIGGTAVLLLFMLHKLPHAVVSTGSRQLEPVLAAIGFSYVALRLVDVIRAVQEGRHRPPDLASTLNYLLPFHMLAAGPIQSYDQFVAQPGVPPPLTIARSFNAIERVTSGLFKKFVLANYLDRLFLTGFHAPGPYFWLEVQLNFIWLYLDFSAYSDVAVGLGTLIGVDTPENFRKPYLARNVIEFWERWHI